MESPPLVARRPVESLPTSCRTLAIHWNCHASRLAVEQVNTLIAFAFALLIPLLFASGVALWWKRWGRAGWEGMVEEDEKERVAWRQHRTQQRHMARARRAVRAGWTRGRQPLKAEGIGSSLLAHFHGHNRSLARAESEHCSSTTSEASHSTHTQHPLLAWPHQLPSSIDVEKQAPPCAAPHRPSHTLPTHKLPHRLKTYRKRVEEPDTPHLVQGAFRNEGPVAAQRGRETRVQRARQMGEHGQVISSRSARRVPRVSTVRSH